MVLISDQDFFEPYNNIQLKWNIIIFNQNEIEIEREGGLELEKKKKNRFVK